MENNTKLSLEQKVVELAKAKKAHADAMVETFRRLAAEMRSRISPSNSDAANDALLSMLKHAEDEEEYWDTEVVESNTIKADSLGSWSPGSMGIGTTLGD